MCVPLAVLPGVGGAAETQVARPQVGAGPAVQAGLPKTLVHVLTATPHLTLPAAAADVCEGGALA